MAARPYEVFRLPLRQRSSSKNFFRSPHPWRRCSSAARTGRHIARFDLNEFGTVRIGLKEVVEKARVVEIFGNRNLEFLLRPSPKRESESRRVIAPTSSRKRKTNARYPIPVASPTAMAKKMLPIFRALPGTDRNRAEVDVNEHDDRLDHYRQQLQCDGKARGVGVAEHIDQSDADTEEQAPHAQQQAGKEDRSRGGRDEGALKYRRRPLPAGGEALAIADSVFRATPYRKKSVQ